MTFLIVGGDSGIAKATLAALGDAGLPAVVTTRRRETLGPNRVFLDVTPPLDDWQPPSGLSAVCICAAVASLADCARDPAGSERVNVTGTIALVKRLAACGLYTLYLSTDRCSTAAGRAFRRMRRLRLAVSTAARRPAPKHTYNR